MKKVLFGILGILTFAAISMASENFTGTILLGSPTNDSITINVVTTAAMDYYFEYGTNTGVYTNRTDTIHSAANVSTQSTIVGLQDNTLYYYRMGYCLSGTTKWAKGDERSFHTRRPPGSTFTFTIVSDAHAGEKDIGNGTLYDRTLTNVLEDNPDFHLDLGDTFEMSKVTNEEKACQAYLDQRTHMGIISQSVPIFLVLGNHEREQAWNLYDRTYSFQSLCAMSVNARKLYYPNPIADDNLFSANGFYSGNIDESRTYINGSHHLLQDYYAWEWGDALFVVIDPFLYTTVKPYKGSIGGDPSTTKEIGDRWSWTMGDQQYQWFKQTLENSHAKFKFVFSHHMTGGIDTKGYGRGGAAAASYFEWGGKNEDDTWGFAANRPGWDTPIRQLMVENNVTIFFHGHDHFFCKENIDGMVYQLCPMPSDTSSDARLGFYGESGGHSYYPSGVVLSNSGHLRVTVSPSKVTVDFVHSALSSVVLRKHRNDSKIAYTYTIAAGSGNKSPIITGGEVTKSSGRWAIWLLGNNFTASMVARIYYGDSNTCQRWGGDIPVKIAADGKTVTIELPESRKAHIRKQNNVTVEVVDTKGSVSNSYLVSLLPMK